MLAGIGAGRAAKTKPLGSVPPPPASVLVDLSDVDLVTASAFREAVVPIARQAAAGDRGCLFVNASSLVQEEAAIVADLPAYPSRYTHRVAISNSRLLALDERGVTFRCKDYRAKGRTRYKAMTLAPDEFMRRFLLHVLPAGFHRIRHYGLFLAGQN
jgi:hypothetical protein